jgi:hypothetical protein
MRVAVLGLYNSGSTAIAGMLDILGVNMGPPYWCSWTSELNFYEPYDLSHHLRKWWNEPYLTECVRSVQRTRFLRAWIQLQESTGAAHCGAKHPLLSLCGPDLLEAWGSGTRFIWAYRPLEDSIAGLERRNWFKGVDAARMQRQLWNTLHDFEHQHGAAMVRLLWPQIKRDPAWAVDQLCSLLGLQRSEATIGRAVSFVR